MTDQFDACQLEIHQPSPVYAGPSILPLHDDPGLWRNQFYSESQGLDLARCHLPNFLGQITLDGLVERGLGVPPS